MNRKAVAAALSAVLIGAAAVTALALREPAPEPPPPAAEMPPPPPPAPDESAQYVTGRSYGARLAHLLDGRAAEHAGEGAWLTDRRERAAIRAFCVARIVEHGDMSHELAADLFDRATTRFDASTIGALVALERTDPTPPGYAERRRQCAALMFLAMR